MSSKITDLTSGSPAVAADEFYANRAGADRKLTVGQIAAFATGNAAGQGATVTADAPVLNLTQTWNNAAITFNGIKLTITDTASAANPLLLNLVVGTASIFSVRRLELTGTKYDRTVLNLTQFSYVFRPVGGFTTFGSDSSNLGVTIDGSSVKIISTGIFAITSSAQDSANGTVDMAISRVAAGVAKIHNNAGGHGAVVLAPVAVAFLPSAATAGNGAHAHVTDATAPTWGATVTGGGAVSCPVYSDGSAWRVG